jgi:hypothetical protein
MGTSYWGMGAVLRPLWEGRWRPVVGFGRLALPYLLRIANTPLERLDARFARATQPRRPGEPRWRWVKRTAGGAALKAEILAEAAVLLDRQIIRLEAEDDK